MNRLLLILMFAPSLHAQTNIYAQASGPQAQTITGAANASPMVITTLNAHGFSSSCNTTSHICPCSVNGTPMGTGVSPANGNRECVRVDNTHLALYDTSGNPIDGTSAGAWWVGYTVYPNITQGAQWVAPTTQFTIPANPGPLAYLDGTNGDLNRRVAVGPLNGVTSVVTTGCPSTCVVTITVSYNLSTGKFPIAAGHRFSLNGSGTALDTCGDGLSGGATNTAQAPYTVASFTTSTVVSQPFSCSIANRNYVGLNMTCGPDSPPDDGLGGTAQDCLRWSQMGWKGNSWWDHIVSQMTALGFNSGTTYKTTFDGGSLAPGNGIHAYYGMAAMRFKVDPTNVQWLNIMIYSLNHVDRQGGVGYAYNSAAWVSQTNSTYNYTDDEEGLTLSLGEAYPYWASSEAAAADNFWFGDVDDPTLTACTTTNQDAANQSTHNWALSPQALLAAGTNDAAHMQLPSGDPHFSTAGYYVGTIAKLDDGGSNDYRNATYGLITAHTSGGVVTVGSPSTVSITGAATGSSTGACGGSSIPCTVFTVSGSPPSGYVTTAGGTGNWAAADGTEVASATGTHTFSISVDSTAFGAVTGSFTYFASTWMTAGGGGGGVPPLLSSVVSGTYTSGLTCSGTTGQTVGISLAGGALVYATLSGSTPSGALTVVVPGIGLSTGSTTGSVVGSYGSASCTGTATVSIVAGTPYTIFDSVTTSSTTGGATATVTFTKTASLSGTINVGDGIMGYNGWGSNFSLGTQMSYVSAVGSNTLTVINGPGITTSSTASMAWRFPKPTTGDCGYINVIKRQVSNSTGVQAAVYGSGVNPLVTNTGIIDDNQMNGGGANTTSVMLFDLQVCAQFGDARACKDFARTQSALFNWSVRPLIDFSTGRLLDGPSYSTDQDTPSGDVFVWGLTNSLSGYPNLGITGSWGQNISLWNMFSTLPDIQGGIPSYAGWGTLQGYQGWVLSTTGPESYGTAFNPAFSFAPLSNNAAWYRKFREIIYPSTNLWGQTENLRQALGFLHNDPRIPSTDYTVQPLQFAFITSGSGVVTADTGWTHLYSGHAVISRTSWTDPTATLTLFDSATYTTAASYDAAHTGQLSIWKTGCLLGADSNPCNYTGNATVNGDAFGFAGAGQSQFKSGRYPNIGDTPITQWAQANAGSYGSQYGDSASRYAAACTDATPNYDQTALGLSIDHVHVCWGETKKSGNDQFISQFHDAALSVGSTAMAWKLHYPQSGVTQSGGPSGGMCGSPCTSSTTYLGGNVIEELEDGGGSGGQARVHGLMSYVTSPGTIFLSNDGSSYSGNQGHAYQFTVAGGSSVGANVSSFTSVVVHKPMANLSDTTFNGCDGGTHATPFGINPDSNWTGVQVGGATSCAIFMYARGGVLHNSITAFSITNTSAAPLLFMGFTAGTYAVTLNGTPVTGSPFTVGSGDSSIYIDSITAGTVAITNTSTCSITTTTLPGATVGTPYNQTIATANCTPNPPTSNWTISSGTLCAGLSLGATTGTITGTPTGNQVCSFTVQVIDTVPNTATMPLSIAVTGGLTVTMGLSGISLRGVVVK